MKKNIDELLQTAKVTLMNDPEFKPLTFGEGAEILEALKDRDKIEIIDACYMLGYYSARK